MLNNKIVNFLLIFTLFVFCPPKDDAVGQGSSDSDDLFNSKEVVNISDLDKKTEGQSNDLSKKIKFICVEQRSKVFETLFTAATFVTKNKLHIKYFGSRYSVRFLQAFLRHCDSQESEIAKLNALQFDALFFDKEFKGIVIKDCLRLKNITFNFCYKDDNQIKKAIYSSSRPAAPPLCASYKQYSQIVGLDLTNQMNKPISLHDVKASVEKLRNYLKLMGYEHVDIGYELTQDPEKKMYLNLSYHVYLGDSRRTSIRFYGGVQQLNEKFKGEAMKIPFSIFEKGLSYIYNPTSINAVKSMYESEGYYDCKVFTYYDHHKNYVVYNINQGVIFKIDNYEVELIDNIGLSEKEKDQAINKINKINCKKQSEYSFSKVVETLKLLNKIYGPRGYVVTHVVIPSVENKTISIFYKVSFKDVAMKKTLLAIKCTGNIKVGSEKINTLLSKKVGDQISDDNILQLRRNLLQTGWFSDVKMKLVEEGLGFVLIVELKEVFLWKMPDATFNIDPFSVSTNIGKKSFCSFLGDAGLSFSYSYRDKQSNWSCTSSYTGYLPNGKYFQIKAFSHYVDFFSKAEEVFSLDRTSKLFRSEANSSFGIGLVTHLFDKLITIDVKMDKMVKENESKKKYIPHIRCEFDLFEIRGEALSNKSFMNFNISPYFDIKLTKEDFKNFVVGVIANFSYYYYVFYNFYFTLQLEGGYLYHKDDDPYKNYVLYQTVFTGDLGYLGPKSKTGKVSNLIGGNSKFGLHSSLNYTIPNLPVFLQGTSLFVKYELGTIFNAKKLDYKSYIAHGVFLGVGIPLQGININIHYFWPMMEVSDSDLTTVKGLGMSVSLNMAGFFQNYL